MNLVDSQRHHGIDFGRTAIGEVLRDQADHQEQHRPSDIDAGIRGFDCEEQARHAAAQPRGPDQASHQTGSRFPKIRLIIIWTIYSRVASIAPRMPISWVRWETS